MANITDVTDYEDLLVPAGNYMVVVDNAEMKVTKNGDPMIVLHAQVQDTIPSGKDLDLDNFEDPIEKWYHPVLFMPDDNKKDGDEKWKYNSALRSLQGYINNFDVEIDKVEGSGDLTDPEYVANLAEAFVGREGGIVLSKKTKDGKDYIQIARSCALA